MSGFVTGPTGAGVPDARVTATLVAPQQLSDSRSGSLMNVNGSVTEYPLEAIDGLAHLKALIERYAAYTATLRRAIDQADEHHDKSTADLFTEISRTADKQLWFLEAHVQA